MIAKKHRRHRRDLDAKELQRKSGRAVSDVAMRDLRLNRNGRHEATPLASAWLRLPGKKS